MDSVIEIAEIAKPELFDSALFIVAKCNAEMMIGDQASRIGRHPEAEARYEDCHKNYPRGATKKDVPGERADLWKLNRSLVIRWLGSVRMQQPALTEETDFFGACAKAIRTIGCSSKDVLLSGSSALREWASISLGRSAVTDRIRTDADVDERRLRDLRALVVSRQEFRDLTSLELGQIDQLVLDFSKNCQEP